MTQIYIKYNPYRLKTTFIIDGREVSEDSQLIKLTKGKRLQEWIDELPEMLFQETNDREFLIEFCGTEWDWDDFEEAFERADRGGFIRVTGMKHQSVTSDVVVYEKIPGIICGLQRGPFEELRSEKLRKAYDNVFKSVFPVQVIATMSSGKSTLINAMLGKRLMPSKNEACTATITEIVDNDNPNYTAVVYNRDGNVIEKVDDLTYDVMERLNENRNVYRICVKGDIPFLTRGNNRKDTYLMLIDTPGPNNSRDLSHRKVTFESIHKDPNSLILYVLNGTQLGTNDDAEFLRYVAEQVKQGGKQIRDRFLFVINKMDAFNPEEEDIESVIQTTRKYLEGFGIEDPQLFPCSAFTALNIRTTLDGIDVENLSRAEIRSLPLAARETLNHIEKLNDGRMSFEKYSVLAPTARRALDQRLQDAVEAGDSKEQALIHSGIYSIEAAIKAYVKKYATTKKIKDLVETAYEILEENKIFPRLKDNIAQDTQSVMECLERIDDVKARIADAKRLKKELEDQRQEFERSNPAGSIIWKAEELKNKLILKINKIFAECKGSKVDFDKAMRIIRSITRVNYHAVTELTQVIEEMVDNDVVWNGQSLLNECQARLSKFDGMPMARPMNLGKVSRIKTVFSDVCARANIRLTDLFAEISIDLLKNINKVRINPSITNKIDTRKKTEDYYRWWKISKTGNKNSKKTFIDLEQMYNTSANYIEETIVLSEIRSIIVDNILEEWGEGIEEVIKYVNLQMEEIGKEFDGYMNRMSASSVELYDEYSKYTSDKSRREKELVQDKERLAWLENCIYEIESVMELKI